MFAPDYAVKKTACLAYLIETVIQISLIRMSFDEILIYYRFMNDITLLKYCRRSKIVWLKHFKVVFVSGYFRTNKYILTQFVTFAVLQ